MKALITTIPFGKNSSKPLDVLTRAGIEYTINPLNKKLTEEELASILTDYDILIAGTETISDYVLDNGTKLKFISRVGVGTDNIDIPSARKRGIKISYTPNEPIKPVAELTVGLIISTLRMTFLSNMKMHNYLWERYIGKTLSDCIIGIVGSGKIGTQVIRLISAFQPKKILVYDIKPKNNLGSNDLVEYSDFDSLIKNADVISLHVPLTAHTKNMIGLKELHSMKKDCIIVNTSRGGVINESDLYKVMKNGHLMGVALDVFEKEPYSGQLCEIENCFLTAHTGTMTTDCRINMELSACEEAVRFVNDQNLKFEFLE